MHARVTNPKEWLTISESSVMVTIELTYAEIDCFITYLPIGSDLSVKMASAEIAVFPKIRLVGFSKMVECTEVEARKLLHIAQQHEYFDAVDEIQRSMRSSGV